MRAFGLFCLAIAALGILANRDKNDILEENLKRQRRIVNGTEAKRHSHSYIASIEFELSYCSDLFNYMAQKFEKCFDTDAMG